MAKVEALKSSSNTIVLDPAGAEAIANIQIGEVFEIDMPSASTGTVSMLRTWRMWMDQMAKFMADNGAVMPLFPGRPDMGVRRFNANDAHEAFTHLLLGCDEGGQRYSWSMGKGKNIAPKSKRLYAMDKLIAMAFERGVALKIPRNSEYEQLKKQQED